MNYFLGVDMGGTNLRFGLVDEKGKIHGSSCVSTEAGTSRKEILKKMEQGIRALLEEERKLKVAVKAVGVGVPGCVDFDRGFIHTLVNIPGWDDVPLANILQEAFHLPVFVDNDVNVMALGELVFGAAQGAKNVICITLGTGVGGGIIVEGKLYRGSSFTAGEIGHSIIHVDGLACNCGGRGCLERYVGNRYLVERALEKYRVDSKRKIPDPLTPEILAAWAQEGEKVALQLWKDMAKDLGMVLASLVNFFNPDLMVIGGGVAQAGKVLFEPLENFVRERSMKVPGACVRIVRAKLGQDAGVIGAAALAMGK
ncbi:MAG: ROK family protein [Chlamydiae bacterium]|nr:ROK family protein [Chlamydiota bacterium]MBI3265911.1 ROK family protein [Chlamydiota bacterium]